MTDIAKQAVAASVHFEAKKHAYRQTQDGVVISFVMHPGDVASTLATAPLGTRYVVALVEVSDDETPVSPDEQKARGKPAKDRRPWHDLPLSQQAAIRCNEPRFQQFIADRFGGEVSSENAAKHVRSWCQVYSRGHIEHGTAAGDAWIEIEKDFQFWLKHPEAA